jgi:hypothetical protein
VWMRPCCEPQGLVLRLVCCLTCSDLLLGRQETPGARVPTQDREEVKSGREAGTVLPLQCLFDAGRARPPNAHPVELRSKTDPTRWAATNPTGMAMPSAMICE